jgi:hypothetical protein
MRWNKTEDIDMLLLRSTVGEVIESRRFDEWLVEVPDRVLVQIAAPFEMLTFQYYLDPPNDRHLVRAARVACDAVESSKQDCPEGMTHAFGQLSGVVSG